NDARIPGAADRGLQPLLLPLRRDTASGRGHQRDRFRQPAGRFRRSRCSDPACPEGCAVLRAGGAPLRNLSGRGGEGAIPSPPLPLTPSPPLNLPVTFRL